MKVLISLLLVAILSLPGFTQIPVNRYFDDVNGSIWLSSLNINDKTIMKEKEIGLTLWEYPIDSIKINSTFWVFSDSLTIQHYNSATNKYSIILSCGYIHMKNERKIKLFIDNKNRSELSFMYSSISTGSYVVLTREKLKKKK
jgi:hypothetical protein